MDLLRLLVDVSSPRKPPRFESVRSPDSRRGDESHDAEKCLAGEVGTRVLIVTSDFHTRRALSIFRHEVHGKSFSVAAARDDKQFGSRWWTNRQWAKTCFDEWLRLVWWNGVERWH